MLSDLQRAHFSYWIMENLHTLEHRYLKSYTKVCSDAGARALKMSLRRYQERMRNTHMSEQELLQINLEVERLLTEVRKVVKAKRTRIARYLDNTL